MKWQILRSAVILVAFSAGSVAVAAAPARCHLYRIWNYPWPQTCRVFKYAAMAPVRRDPPLPPVSEILIPDMTNIDWGQLADESARGKILLRAAMEEQNGNH